MSKVMPDTPIISLWMPWANWVSLGWKTIETRTHQRFKGLVGKRIGIHATQKWDESAIELARPYLEPEQVLRSKTFSRIGGGIICTATVEAHVGLCEDDSPAALIECNLTKRYGLLLKDVEMIEVIPCKGKRGIWYFKDGAHE